MCVCVCVYMHAGSVAHINATLFCGCRDIFLVASLCMHNACRQNAADSLRVENSKSFVAKILAMRERERERKSSR